MVVCALDYLIFGTFLRGKAKNGLCGNVMQLATKGTAPGQPQEVPLCSWHGSRACGLCKDAGSFHLGKAAKEAADAWGADFSSLKNLGKGWLVEKGTVIWEHIYTGYGK